MGAAAPIAGPIAGAVIGGMMSKGGGTQTINSDPWGPAQGQLRFGLSELDRIYGRPAPFYQTPMMGPFGSTMQRAYGTGNPWTPGAGTIRPQQPIPTTPTGPLTPAPNPVQEYGLLDPAAAELMRTIQGERVGQNPYLEDVIRRASADVNSQFAGMGRYGSGAHMDQLFSKAAAPIRYEDYARERANQLAAVQAAPGFEMAPYQLYGAQQAAPYEGIRNYLDLVGNIGRGGGSQSSPIYNNPLAGALGGGLLGYQLSSGGKTQQAKTAPAGSFFP